MIQDEITDLMKKGESENIEFKENFDKEAKLVIKRQYMEDIFEVLYVARNNLFHGDKKITDQRDEKVVRLSYRVLRLFMKEIISRDFKI